MGYVTSGGFGHRIRASLALGFVRRDLANAPMRLEISILGEVCEAEVLALPPYDPANERLRA